MLAELVTQLSHGIAALDEGPSSPGAQLAVEHLHAARKALALLALERAAGAARAEDGPDEAPALECRIELAADARSARAGRLFLRRTLEEWGLPPATVNAAVDVGSELVTNAARETRSHVLLSSSLQSRALVISVWDDGDGRPQLRPYRPGTVRRGIGLLLVKHLSHEWGWHEDPHGKWVWARIALPEQAGSDFRPVPAAEVARGRPRP